MYTLEQLQHKTFKELKEIGWHFNVFPDGDRRCRQNWIDVLVGVQPPLLQLLEVFPGVELVAEAIEVQATEPIESKFGRIVYPKLSIQSITHATKNSLGVSRKTSTPHQLLELFNTSAHIIEDSPGVETEAKVTQSAIGVLTKNYFDAEAGDQNLILAGITFSDGFLACYSPPQPSLIHFKTDADGQLSLLDFEVETEDEPPDPDDFEFLDAFRESIALWDAEHLEPLEISLDSFCEWAPCPDDWYELSEVLELLPASESFSTCHYFSIPTFDAWCDRANDKNDKDEPPDTGIFARLPKPKPPSFPPASVGAGDRCPCGAMPAAQCDGTTATHIYPDRIVFTPCYKHDAAIGIRGSPGGDAMQQ